MKTPQKVSDTAQQADLFRAFARRTDPETSHLSAKAIEPQLPRIEQLILSALKRAGANGLTTAEITDVTGIDRVTVSPRLKPMARKGVAEDSGDRRVGNAGRLGIVWIAKGARDG